MLFMFALGVGCGVGHHFFYRHLDDRAAGTATQQQRVLLLGTALAFLSKAAFLSMMEIARTQWVWVTLRRKFLTLAGIDAVFGVTADLTHFTNGNMLRGAKVATAMAIVMWVFPLGAVLTPGTISVQTVTRTAVVGCTVRTMLFDLDPNPSPAVERICCQNGNTTRLTTISVAAYNVEKKISV